ncbi:cystathionine gamma-synthase [Variibacter gotjawalensis]|uniref:Cystathionine gamma-synthase n=1 Tax=Variibacter gotjawalensis TaxID=1333996 RepID=A0A0S3PPZ1_9BRAD|nr:PLP-dependent aspartate aminotransferase family protein [Variibacter gotjawalensis]NIK48302.1 cystathionine gamma-synthase [Variibacter gotjawalensis]RZS50174.1 cystathionine gamma-synthase [Variibacter gotjawalensis]BAT58004.1 cystathionine gamma-synthase [Variibacter gotjawalensis]
MAKPPLKPRTLAAQAMGAIDPETHAIVPPVHVASTFLRDPDNQYRTGYIYGRPDNATVRQAESVIAALEGAPEALLLGSGMAAATSVILALEAGAHILAPKVMYWALRHWMLNDAPRYGYTVDTVDMTDTAAIKAAIKPGKTKLIWIETPGNPLWTITDIAAVAKIAHDAGAKLAIDSTAATPLLTRPIEHGADIVMHSATKYLNGHSDIIAGALATARADDPLWQSIRNVRARHGAILGPFEAWLLLRGLRTLDVRVRAACETAADLAARFAKHPLIAEVLYPGLASHPDHAIAVKQMQGGFGGMLSVRVKAGEAAAIDAAARVEVWKRATSLGGVESLIEHRASIEGAGSPCPPDLLRLSAGLEDADDLFNDLDRALRGANA